MTLGALVMGGITFMYNIWGIGALIFIQGISMGILDTGNNVCVLWLYSEERAEPYLQALHFTFAVGGFVSPLVIGVVMDAYNDNFNIAFYVIAGCFTPVIIGLALLDSPKMKKQSDELKVVSLKERIFGSFTTDERIIIAASAVFLGIYVGAEVSMGTLVYAYAVGGRELSEQTGYTLTSVFWGLIATGRLLAVPISTRLTPRVMLLINIVGCMVTTGFMMVFDVTLVKVSSDQTLIVLWTCVPIYGLFMASCFPTVFTLAEEMMRLTGKATSFFISGASIGEMVIPAVVAALFGTSIGYFSLVVTVFICSVLMFLFWGCFGLLRRSMEIRGVLPNRKSVEYEKLEYDPREETPLISQHPR